MVGSSVIISFWNIFVLLFINKYGFMKHERQTGFLYKFLHNTVLCWFYWFKFWKSMNNLWIFFFPFKFIMKIWSCFVEWHVINHPIFWNLLLAKNMTVMILSVVLADLIIVAPKSVNFGIRLLTFSILSAIHLISILDLIALRCWSCYDLVWVYVNIKFVFLHTYVGIWVSSSNCEGYFCRANVLLTLEYFIRSIPQGAYLSPLNCRKTMTFIFLLPGFWHFVSIGNQMS